MTSTAVPWRDQATEQARILNPAFVGALVAEAARGYETESPGAHPLPYALAFVAVPVVLHKPTRDTLPERTSTTLAAWIADHPAAQVGFPERARALAPLVKDAILFASRGGLLRIDGTGFSALINRRLVEAYGRSCSSPEVGACLRKAQFLGRWLALAGEPNTVMALWGVRP
ncbi:three component ABC system middle component [Pseudoxanthomonas suwonensis]|uniref:three component ABC system middle component n=1 Tax=Pseudoxanthomonas suwonensis TaxID=314722 RepID=UPI003D187A0D